MDAVAALLHDIAETLPQDRRALRQLKIRAARAAGGGLVRNDALLQCYRRELTEGTRRPDSRLEQILLLNGIRSQSGLATVTVITKPYACPGRCVYCPTEARAPKSYLPNEPAILRALRNEYDPYRQVASRLEALQQTGHPLDKLELIIKGGTWSFYPPAYQEEFIRRCIEAANAFGAPAQPPDGRPFAQVCLENERAACRIIGITVETRPDYVDMAEILRLRELGVTRVELGVQTLDDAVLALTMRDHGTAEVRQATQLLKDAGIKVAYHLMPNLPGATVRSDLESMRQLFADSGYQPDTMKIYPCVVVESAELYGWWRQGRYQPYDDETLLELLVQLKQLVPPYVRLERIIRDIPTPSIRAGCQRINLREEVQRRMRARGLRCRCIRCRQVRDDAEGTFRLTRQTYEASGGTEYFLSMEDGGTDRLASLLRLRIPSAQSLDANPLPELRGAALIRELHTYGRHVRLHKRTDGAAQHQGFGRQLMQEAERIAREEHGLRRLAVIAGIGARPYFERLGYRLEGTYMVKVLA